MAVPLGQVVKFTNGGTPARSNPAFYDGDIPWITGADIAGDGSVRARSFITEDAVRRSSTQVLPAGTVALVTRTSVGKVGVFNEPTAFSQDITAISPMASLDTSYLVHFLRSRAGRLAAAARGATIKGVTRDEVARLEIPLPPVFEQRRIAAILDAGDAIRDRRKSVLQRMEGLIPAVFEEMFGSTEFDLVTLGELVDAIDAGASPNCESRPAAEQEWGVLKLGAVTYGRFRPGENKAFLGDVEPMRANEVRAGDVLMTRKNTRELVGAVAVVGSVRPKLLLPDLVFRIRLNKSRINAHYFQAFMMSGRTRPIVRARSSGSAASMPNISQARLRTLPVRLPPIEMQAAFSARVAAIDAARAKLEGALASDEELFASLQARAFSDRL